MLKTTTGSSDADSQVEVSLDASPQADTNAAVNLPCPADEIQGNILKSFARQYATYLFVRFSDDAGRVRPALQGLLSRFVASAARQADLAAEYEKSGRKAIVEGV